MKLRLFMSALFLAIAHAAVATESSQNDGGLTLHLRSRIETAKDSGQYHAVSKTVNWDPKETAAVICDMWDKHWCAGATRRVAEMAPRMNELADELRKKGVLIIHAPSNTMRRYGKTPQRKLAQDAPKIETKVELKRWCGLDKDREPPLPIDDSDGGCDCRPRCKNYRAWKKQIDVIEIKEGDAITDKAEAFNLMKKRGIKNVIVMGVHTNMCVLGRPFSIRQMVYQGQNVALVRDMTDTMYNPRRRPFVSHFTGTDLVIEHVEKFWCPTFTSADLLGGKPFRFKNDKRLHLAIVMAEDEYETRMTLPEFAGKHLGHDFRVSLVFASRTNRNDIPGIDVLNEADIALLSIRRRSPPKEQLDVVRKFIAAGKPIVGIRTTSHAFSVKKKKQQGLDQWPEFDAEVLGGNYHGHHGNKNRTGPKTYIWVKPGMESHSILTGIQQGERHVRSWLYKALPLTKTTTVLMMGRVDDRKPHEPVAWTNIHSGGGRVFYTSLGHPEEFKLPDFQRLLLNGIFWSASRPVPKRILALDGKSER